MKFTDVNPFSKNEQSKINKSLLSTVKKGDFILGKNVEKFEKKFSKLANVKYSVGCATGTDALILSIKALSLKKKTRGDNSWYVIYFNGFKFSIK